MFFGAAGDAQAIYFFFADPVLRAAQRAFIISDSFLRPAAVMPPPLFRALEAVVACGALAAAAPLLLAQRALAAAESLARCAADIVRPFWLLFVLRAAQRAFIISDSFLRPAAVIPPPLFRALAAVVACGALAEVAPPFFLAQRALAAAESLARCAADIVRPFWLLFVVGEEED
jgi:hypothetical protein